MAGSGDLSRIGWIHALNAAWASAITNAAMSGPPGDLIGTVSTALVADTAITTILTAAGITKAIPTNAVLMLASGGTGAVNTFDIATVNGAAASGAVSVTVQSFRPHVAHNTSSLIYLIDFPPFVSLNTTAPLSHTLGTEYGATGYARQSAPMTGTTVADPPVAANSGTITYGPMTAGTGASITNGALMDASSGGTADNMYAFWTWGTAKTPGVGDSVQFAAANLSGAGS